MTYKPKFTHQAVRRRCVHALGFCTAVLSTHKPRAWSTRYIDQYLGQQQHELSRYLRSQLLIVHSEHWNWEQGKCKQYLLNAQGVNKLRQQLGLETKTVERFVQEYFSQEHEQELITANFQYTDRSSRLFHPLQRIRRQYKQQILRNYGYAYTYDIVAAAPTLIFQHSQHLGMDLYLPVLVDYLTDRARHRQKLAEQLEVDLATAKEIITALFAGARISRHTDSSIFHLCNQDTSRILFLQQDQWIQELKQNIQTCWSYIQPHMSRTRNTQTNRLIPINAKQKWARYFDLERQVLNQIRSYLDLTGMRYFLEHDGWSSDKQINIPELVVWIKEKTGFQLKIEYSHENKHNIQNYPIV